MLKLKDGMGEKLAIVGNLVGTAIISIIVAFPLGWQLTLACLTVVPFSVAASVALSNVSKNILLVKKNSNTPESHTKKRSWSEHNNDLSH